MRAFTGILVVVLALGAGYFVLQNQAAQQDMVDAPPQQQIDVIGIESALRSMANAERQFLVTRGTYASLEQLQDEGLLPGGTEQRGYVFSADFDGSRAFTIVAEPTDPAKSDWPVLSIDETMQVTRQ